MDPQPRVLLEVTWEGNGTRAHRPDLAAPRTGWCVRRHSPHPALDLVEDQRDAMTIRQLSQCNKNVVGNFSHPTLALYRLGETRR